MVRAVLSSFVLAAVLFHARPALSHHSNVLYEVTKVVTITSRAMLKLNEVSKRLSKSSIQKMYKDKMKLIRASNVTSTVKSKQLKQLQLKWQSDNNKTIAKARPQKSSVKKIVKQQSKNVGLMKKGYNRNWESSTQQSRSLVDSNSALEPILNRTSEIFVLFVGSGLRLVENLQGSPLDQMTNALRSGPPMNLTLTFP